jgi:sec-independent protein translocase protein TatA
LCAVVNFWPIDLHNPAILLIFKEITLIVRDAMGLGKLDVILLIVLIIVLLFIGGKKLPELARGIGQSAKEIKKGFRDDEEPEKKSTKK